MGFLHAVPLRHLREREKKISVIRFVKWEPFTRRTSLNYGHNRSWRRLESYRPFVFALITAHNTLIWYPVALCVIPAAVCADILLFKLHCITVGALKKHNRKCLCTYADSYLALVDSQFSQATYQLFWSIYSKSTNSICCHWKGEYFPFRFPQLCWSNWKPNSHTIL